MNNFRYGTDNVNVFVSKAGNDAWDGNTRETPKLTLAAAMSVAGSTKTIIIGAGMYEEAFNSGSTQITAICDGTVKFRGTGSNTFNLRTVVLSGDVCIFENYASVSNTTLGSSYNSSQTWFINITGAIKAPTVSYNRCIFINCPLVGSGAVSTKIDSSIFINSTHYAQGTGGNSGLTNCYFNSSSTIRYTTAQTGGALVSSYNNIMGDIYIGTTRYADLASQIAADPTFNTNSFNQPPKFNNASKWDFTLASDSPHLNASSTGLSNIGGTSYATSSDMAVDFAWTLAGGAVVSKFGDGVNPDLILSGSDWVLAPGKTWGQITSGPILVTSNPQTAGVINYNGLKLYNKSVAGGSATNNNVPDANAYAGADASGGGNPDRLTFELRWTDSDSKPSYNADQDWPNGLTGLIAPGAYTRFEFDKVPQFDAAGKGNGDPAFNQAVVYTPNYTYVQMRFTLTNLYNL
jgi:hypothetical protein